MKNSDYQKYRETLTGFCRLALSLLPVKTDGYCWDTPDGVLINRTVSCLSGSGNLFVSCRKSLTCGYENPTFQVIPEKIMLIEGPERTDLHNPG